MNSAQIKALYNKPFKTLNQERAILGTDQSDCQKWANLQVTHVVCHKAQFFGSISFISYIIDLLTHFLLMTLTSLFRANLHLHLSEINNHFNNLLRWWNPNKLFLKIGKTKYILIKELPKNLFVLTADICLDSDKLFIVNATVSPPTRSCAASIWAWLVEWVCKPWLLLGECFRMKG